MAGPNPYYLEHACFCVLVSPPPHTLSRLVQMNEGVIKRVLKWLHHLIKSELGNPGRNKAGAPVMNSSARSKAAESRFLNRCSISC